MGKDGKEKKEKKEKKVRNISASLASSARARSPERLHSLAIQSILHQCIDTC